MNRFPNKTGARDRRATASVALIAFVVIGIAGYTLAKTRDILRGPSLAIEYPTTGITVHSETLSIIGRALNISSVSIGNRPLFTDEDGYFEEKLLLPYGYSILELTAADRFGRKVTKKIELVYK